MIRLLLLTISAIAGAGAFILFREHAAALQVESVFGAPAPIAGVLLGFPAVYLLWEHHDA